MNRKRKQLLRTPYMLMLPTILFLFFWLFFPFLHNIYLSFYWYPFYKIGVIKYIGLKNYETVITDPTFLRSLYNTGIYLAVSLIIEFVIGLGVAQVLLCEFKGRGIIRALSILPMACAPSAVGLMWKLMFFKGGSVIDYLLTPLGLGEINWLGEQIPAMIVILSSNIWQWMPFSAIILLAGLLAIPVELYEAARIDGASTRQIFTKITLQVLRPVIIIVLILRSLELLKIFDPIYIIFEGGLFTESLSFYIYKTGFRVLELGFAAAASVIFWLLAWIAANIVMLKVRDYFMR